MSIGVVTVAYGDRYLKFLPEWLSAVGDLKTKPDAVKIVTDNRAEVQQFVNASTVAADVIYSDTVPANHPQVLVNEAIALCDTDWICKMDVDDLIYPHALDQVANADCDVLMFGISLAAKAFFAQEISALDIRTQAENLVFSGSPFRRWVWERSQYQDMVYEDWAFWVNAAKNGARFLPSNSIDYEYRVHGNNISLNCNDYYWREQVKAMQ